MILWWIEFRHRHELDFQKSRDVILYAYAILSNAKAEDDRLVKEYGILGRYYPWRLVSILVRCDGMDQNHSPVISGRSNPIIFGSKRTHCHPISMACSKGKLHSARPSL